MIEIKHRITGVVLHTVDADTLNNADLRGASLNWAYLSRANLSGAYLSGADLFGASLSGANLSGADLYGANLEGANLRDANLFGADLIRANLFGADLIRANLHGADLIRANLYGATIYTDKLDRLLARATRLDGFEFFLFGLLDGSTKIKAGCRWMTIEDYRDHVAKYYPDTDKAQETLNILKFFKGAIK